MTDPATMSELSLKAARGMFWSLAENLGLQAMQFLISIILARLLLPAQFGLIGMLTLFMVLAQSLLDSGFGSALIQKKDADQRDACSVFYFNLVLGVLLTGVMCLTAPLIARFYAQPLLTSLTRFLSLSILINSFRLVPSAMLTKRMDFRAMFKISLISVIISGSVGVGLAFLGFGVWSLATQSVMDTVIRMVLTWRASRWKPSWIFSVSALKTMFAFGSRLLVSGLIETFFSNIYQLFIGKVYSAADLGFYVRAQSMQSVAVQPTSSALARVIFPAFVPIQDDKPRMRQAYRKMMTTSVFFHFPLMIGLMAAAGPLITLLMTQRWAPSVPYFQLFCAVGLFWPLHVFNLNILQVAGRSDLFLRLEIAKKILVIVAIAVTYPLGISALIYGQIASSVAAYFLNSYYSGKLVGYSTLQQIGDFSPFLLMSLGMGITMYLVGTAIAPELPRLLAQVGVGAGLYLVLNAIMGQPVLSDVLRLAHNALRLSDTIEARKNA